MNFNEYLVLIKKKKQTIISLVILFALFAVVMSLIQPFKYGAETKLLVVQNNQTGIDPYQTNKANEYVAEVLADVIPTTSFYNEVVNSGFNINQNYFTVTAQDQLKKWQDTVRADAGSRGMIAISVFHEDRQQAEQIINAINVTLKSKHNLYHGSGDQVSIRVVDQPLVSTWPVKPNIIMNLVMALAFGFLFAFSYVYLFPESKYDLKIGGNRKRAAQRRYYEEENDFEVAGSGINRNTAYDVQEAIARLRQRERSEMENFMSQAKPTAISADSERIAGRRASDFPFAGNTEADYRPTERNYPRESRPIAQVENNRRENRYEEVLQQGKMDNVF